MSFSRGSWVHFLIMLLLVACVWQLEQPPHAKPSDVSVQEFSAHRALQLIRGYAVQPHRAGTAANDVLRQKLIDALTDLRLIVVTEEPTICRGTRVGNPRNIYARLPGRRSQLASASFEAMASGTMAGAPASLSARVASFPSAFLLMAHYDSVPFGPGAADDLAGVAAILEAVRAIQAGPPLANDLIIAFTDGEECGLLGAKAFSQHPWAAEVGCLLNFEARGICGPSYLFELGAPKTWLVAEMARSGAPLRTSSLMFDIYRRLPFSTDYHLLRDSIPGMNAAFIGYFPYYHSSHDTSEHLSSRSLQHHGEYALAFARHFGSLDRLATHPRSDLIYFSGFGSQVIQYSHEFGIFLTIILTACSVFVLRLPFRDPDGQRSAPDHTTPDNILVQSAPAHWRTAFKASFSLSLLAGLFSLIPLIGGYLVHGPYLLYANWWVILAGVSLALACFAAKYAKYRLHISLTIIHKGFIGLWIIGMLVQQLFLPAGTFLWHWPLLFGLLAITISAIFSRHRHFAFIDLGLFTLLTATLSGISVPLCFSLGEVIGVFSVPLLSVWLILIAGLLLPWLDPTVVSRKRGLVLTFSLSSLAGFVGALALAAPSIDCPRMTHLLQDIDAHTSTTRFYSAETHLSDWTKEQLDSDTLKVGMRHAPGHLLWQGSTRQVSETGTLAQLASETTGSGSQRILSIVLTPTNKAQRLLIQGSSATEVAEVAFGRTSVELHGKAWEVDYSILPRNPLQMTVTLAASAALDLRLTEIRYGIPVSRSPRAPGLIPMNNVLNRGSRFESDTVHVRTHYRL
ncbi:MAG TPA: M20/M25/M40 family metallo-hydrolase [Candidatus Ozemobacteraceae bacterium]|nr:M20/M25/M40 family metallo-hydrolase [Candidatus Ozemobacteraceae bacterium]